MELLSLPVRGTWLVLTPPGHGRHAHDLVALNESHSIGDGSWLSAVRGRISASDLEGWNRPVVAPCSGRIVSSVDGHPDRLHLNLLRDVISGFITAPIRHRADPSAMAGNHVVIDAGGSFAVLAHLREGSVAVAEGDRVTAGQQIGRVGNSGNSVGPHLHFHLGVSPGPGRVLPFLVDEFEQDTEDGWVRRQGQPLPRRGKVRSVR